MRAIPAKRTKWMPPYNNKGGTNFPVRGVPGVYVVRKAGRFRYVGYSASDVYKALYRHFQTWNDRRGERVTYSQLHDIQVRVIYCRTPGWAKQLEKALILKLKPTDNPDKLKEYTLTPAGEQYAKAIDDAAWAPIGETPPF